MQIEGVVAYDYVVLPRQPVDPSLADVAPRSDEVAEDGQLDRHDPTPKRNTINARL
ncbi:MAG TPA: hypothetical protein VFC51_16290 [Chloroflexota bacterium]|nr:hypothetical protein [Chloroflexota bacterium]